MTSVRAVGSAETVALAKSLILEKAASGNVYVARHCLLSAVLSFYNMY
jgi:hypothetical protein